MKLSVNPRSTAHSESQAPAPRTEHPDSQCGSQATVTHNPRRCSLRAHPNAASIWWVGQFPCKWSPSWNGTTINSRSDMHTIAALIFVRAWSIRECCQTVSCKTNVLANTTNNRQACTVMHRSPLMTLRYDTPHFQRYTELTKWLRDVNYSTRYNAGAHG